MTRAALIVVALCLAVPAAADSLHQPPGIAAGLQGEIYVTWSARKPVPVGGLFASDLYLSRSLDGGATWNEHVRLNDDQPTSHSFEGLAVAPDGTVLVAWIETRDGKAATMLARVTERGTRVAEPIRLDTGETCVCCRVDVAAGPGENVDVLWRKVFPDNVRDMVLGVSRDGGRTFAAPALVHADGWKITACPHRGGSVATDARGRLYAIWYTEATEGRPDVLFATSTDGRRFSPPRRLHRAPGSIPDQARLAVDAAGRGVVVWEDSTAVRRRVVLRTTRDGGRTLSPPQSLSPAIKAFAPAVATTPGGFIIVWHEEQFPSIKTVVQTLTLGEGAR
jgi:outer membrane protein assembly factor BamB